MGKFNDYEQLNHMRKIQVISNYRGYDQILFMRPFPNTYLGYIGNDFFGFTVPDGEQDTKHWLMEPEEAIDHYLDKTFFHNPSLEYNTFVSKPLFRPYVNALKLKFDNGNKTKT